MAARMFSSRLPDLAPNRFSASLSALRSSGIPLIDLTESNPTKVGLSYPGELLDALTDPGGLTYEPEPFGLAVARRAVAGELLRHDVEIGEDRIVLTSSTSEAYSVLFKLLCEPGDEVLVPRPSYPLFDHLTGLDAVAAVPYRLEYHGRWQVDLESISNAVSARTRAILLVNPNNPTGSFVRREEADAIGDLARAHGLAVIADEVFSDYELAGTDGGGRSLSALPDTLVFTLGGLSKSVGLPQMKLAWLTVSGQKRLVQEALARLELICDTYLSVSTAVQRAAPMLLNLGAVIRRQIIDRVRANFRQLRQIAGAYGDCAVLLAEGGWYGVVQVPSTSGEEETVLQLLNLDRVVVHPGYFFDFPREAFLVVSLLPPQQVFAEGVERVLARATSMGAAHEEGRG
jgi:aspartate/methionine/tyrosine aminotransferase